MPDVNRNLFELARNHGAPDRKPIICLEGGSRSGKTWAILEYLINCCLEMPGLVVSCFRHDATTHMDAAARDFLLLMPQRFPRSWTAGTWNKVEKEFRFASGSLFEFVGANNPLKLHGPQRDIAWLNEAMEITYEAYAEISKRTSLLQIFDWNPSLSHHWVFDKVLTRPDALYVHSTYRDNPHLPVAQVAEIEKFNPEIPENVRRGTADKWQWDVYGLGRRGRRTGVIYTEWTTEDTWPERMACQRWGYGLDFGFSEDPTALIECAAFQGDIWVREVVYRTGLVVRESESLPGLESLVGLMKDEKVNPTAIIVADGARPDLIKELRISGYQGVTAGDKGPGSILTGINLLRGFRWRVARNSQNIQRELEQYVWKVMKTSGTVTDVPEDANNHAMDAIRYWAARELRGGLRQASGVYQSYEAETCLRQF